MQSAESADARLIAFLVIAVLVAVAGFALRYFVGEHWWRVLIVLIAAPILCWAAARTRDRYMRHVAGELGLRFDEGFPAIPAGSPAYGRSPFGFTAYSISSQRDDGTILNVYEHSYRHTRRVYIASGVWWRQKTSTLPEFDVSVRSLLSFFPRETIDFRDDPVFAARFVVRGKQESRIRELFTPQLRAALLADLDRGTLGGKGTILGWDRPSRIWGRRALTRLMPRCDRLRRAFNEAARA